MQVAVLFTVRLLWGNVIGLLRKQVIGKVCYYYFKGQFAVCEKPGGWGANLRGQQMTQPQKPFLSWRCCLKGKGGGCQSERWKAEYNAAVLHVALVCHFHANPKVLAAVFSSGTAVLALRREKSTCPRAELSAGTMWVSVTSTRAISLAHLCSRNCQPHCPVTHFWFFPSEPSRHPELSKLFLPVRLGEDSQQLLELPFLSTSSLFELKEAFIYRGDKACALCCLLDLEFLSTDCTRSSNKVLHLVGVSLWIHLLPFMLCITALFGQKQPDQFDCTISSLPRDTEVCSIYNWVLHFRIFQQERALMHLCCSYKPTPAKHQKASFGTDYRSINLSPSQLRPVKTIL